MRRSTDSVNSPRARSAVRIDLPAAQPAKPDRTLAFAEFLLRVHRARRLARRNPARAASTLSDWIACDD